MKTVTLVSSIGLIAGLLALAYGKWGPWYPRVAAQGPLSFSDESPEPLLFRVHKKAKYLIEVHFEPPLNRDELIPILGDPLNNGGGSLDIEWRVLNDGKTISSGSNITYGYSPFFGRTYGVTIGSFTGEPDTSYMLSLTPRNREPGWNVYAPFVSVGQHPSDFEYLVIYSLVGLIATLFFAFTSACCSIVLILRRRKEKLRAAHTGI